MVVSRVRVTFAVGAVLLWAVTPVLACLLPCLAMAPAKQECSRHMAMHCGRSMVAASSTCCQMSSHTGITTVETPVNKLQNRVFAVVPVVGHFSRPEVPTPTSLAFLESPPHEGPPLSSSVLRI